MEIKNVSAARMKAGPDDGLSEGEFLVYPSTFTRTPDSYGDVVHKDAFNETIARWKESGNVLPGIFGHRMDDPDFFVAWATEMGVDDHGWWIKGEFDLENPKAKQVYRLVKGRRLTQLSFAFDVIEEGMTELEDGTKANELRKLDVYEFSFVPIGANQDTSVVAIKATAEAVAADLKAGRTISAKNETSLRTAYEAIGQVLDTLGQQDDPDKASGDGASRKSEASSSASVTRSPSLELIEALFQFIKTPQEAES
ncbi:HK97 family phage prohead protease [Gordonia sp. HY442]|uniref:HK97 family phage prohead protease n=1 Tax=Gordonia zhenghanii TaxID=2911516 RepID=UPI001F029B69|nr:HK97 family phage prohead protease [Gordonia zhenghanii]MCF8605145.1 HK97 family phage prohead protease [Gordonia zhenghanii]